MEKTRTYAVIGAGPVGYVLSILLALKGYNVELFEKRSNPLTTLQSDEWRSTNFLLLCRAFPAFRKVGVLDEVLKYSAKVDKLKIVLSDLDEFELNYRGKGPEDVAFSLNRKELQKVLAKRIQKFQDKIKIQYNATILNVQIEKSSFDVKHQDGNVEIKSGYDMIFGTDGIHSAVQQAFQQLAGFSFQREYNGYGYTELQIPALESQEGNKFRVQEKTFFHWPRKELDTHMWGMPNYNGDINIGLILKIAGENSFEYFKTSGFQEFQKFLFEHFPDTRYLMPNLKDLYDKCQLTRIQTMKCGPWRFGNFMLVGDSSHCQNPFGGLGFNGNMEECSLIDDLIDKHQCNWNLIGEEFYAKRKPIADKMNEYGDTQFAIFKYKLFEEPIQISMIIQDYMSRYYGDIFQTVSQLIRYQDKDFIECLNYGPVQSKIFNELKKEIPNFLDVVRTGKFDQRVYDILAKYKDITDLRQIEIYSKSQADKAQSAGKTQENLFSKYLPSYHKNKPRL
ncbi:kynurenine 3-monooxygenase [Stylonychia lemnae]|uniref:Kynurenine 3-monooxygenase n=1 Tax=Stylonychia lemnae TaxID=5949 RepID=A0A077ZW52_STYLE|nr:kynurenine 3-monooxygenase [Stylonychia lemnae]|eukprot:CDW72681.1 kynurenine 3-monooxygenase [Stylonychia lemnae]